MKRDYWQDSWLFWGATGDARKSTCFYDHLDYWSEDNPGAYYPRPYFGAQPGGGGDKHLNKNQYCQSRYLQSGAYIRLKCSIGVYSAFEMDSEVQCVQIESLCFR